VSGASEYKNLITKGQIRQLPSGLTGLTFYIAEI